MATQRATDTRTGLFSQYALDHCYDEMFDASGVARAPYEALYRRLLELSPADLRQRQQNADSAFLHQGVTFTVYGDQQGTERIFPYDLLPRVITAREWETIERGLIQRLTALILKEGVVPRHLVYSVQHYRREMLGVRPRKDIYVSVAGSDLVRLPDGQFAVLEDNLRVPSGVSYMLTNRQIIKRVFPAHESIVAYDARDAASSRPRLRCGLLRLGGGLRRQGCAAITLGRRGIEQRCERVGR